MMDKDRLEQIERRASEATPGPWEADTGVRGDCVVFGPNGRFLMNAQSEPHWMPYPGETRYVSFDVDKRDAEFIADARKDVPELVGEVRRLQGIEASFKALADEKREIAGHAMDLHVHLKNKGTASAEVTNLALELYEDLAAQAERIEKILGKEW